MLTALGCALEMQHGETRKIADEPSGGPHSRAPFDIFAIHEHAFIHAANILDCRTAHHHAGAANPIDVHLIAIEQSRVRQIKAAHAAQQTLQQKAVDEHRCQPDPPTGIAHLMAAVGVQQLRPARGDLSTGVKMIGQAVDRGRVIDESVRIEQ